jgi:hypothetical protein
MLGKDDQQDPQNLANKADKLWALHDFQKSTVASVEFSDSQELTQVTAVALHCQGHGSSHQ